MAVQLCDLTTIRLGGPAGRYEIAPDSARLVELVSAADAAGEPVLVLGGGSNLVVGDAGFDGLVVQVCSQGFELQDSRVRVDAGVEWDSVVSRTLQAGLAGLEALSGIPGSTGGTPIQNVGAYGALTSQVLAGLTVFDRHSREVERWPAERCAFGPHRQSVFKRNDRYLILDVTFALARSLDSAPLAYAALADRLGLQLGATARAAEVRQAVLSLRRDRGMVLEPADHDTWSVGSFFLNPVVAEVPDAAAGCPRYPDPAGFKLPAAWLIEHAGFGKGYGAGFGSGRVALSGKHTLAITNRGGASTAETMALAAHIRDGVQDRFGIRLEPECDLVNCSF